MAERKYKYMAEHLLPPEEYPTPSSLPSAMADSAAAGGSALVSLLAKPVSFAPGKLGDVAKDISDYMKEQSEKKYDAVNRFQGNFAEETAAQLPYMAFNALSEVANPFGKLRTGSAIVNEAIPLIGNAAYAGTRSYLSDPNINKALRAAALNVIGEKVAEPLLGGNLAGNVAGSVAENTLNTTPWDALKTAYKLLIGADESQRSVLNPKYKTAMDSTIDFNR